MLVTDVNEKITINPFGMVQKKDGHKEVVQLLITKSPRMSDRN